MSTRSPAKFILSAASAADFPRTGLPEIAFVGRSNVGKSSLVNALAGKTIARTSGAPGKTRLANYYLIDDGLYFVDLPGYGYARGGPDSAREFQVLTRKYFAVDAESRRRIAGILHLIDARHPDLPQDEAAHQWILQIGIPIAIVATKTDKLNRAELSRHLDALQGAYDTIVLPVAVMDGKGLAEIWKTIRGWVR
jgi:GTP-binding protein